MASVVRGGYRGEAGAFGLLGRLVYHLLSFELVFVAFLYSNELKMFLGWVPGDETVTFGALSILIGAYVILREGIYLRGLITVAAAVLFIAWAFVTIGWTPSIETVNRTASYLATFNLWCVVAGALIIANNRERAVRLFCFIMALALCLTLMGLNVYFTYGTFRMWEGWKDADVGRVYLAWGYTVADGTVVMLCVALFARFATLKQMIAMALFLTCAFFLLVGGGRAPFLGVVVACTLAFILNPPIIGRNRFDMPVAQVLAIGIFVTAAAYVAYLFLAGEATNTLLRFVRAIDSVEDSAVADGPSRVQYWPAAVQLWLASPWVGQGLAGFSMLFYGREIAGGHPHNFVLEILAEQGLIGLVLFFVFIWTAARQITIRRLRVDPLLLACVMVATTGAMSAMFAKDLAGGKKVFFVIGLLALRPPAIDKDTDEDADEGDGADDAPIRSRYRRRNVA